VGIYGQGKSSAAPLDGTETVYVDKAGETRQATVAQVAAFSAASIATSLLLGWAYAQAFQLVTATRDANGAITTASVVWPDGATGTFTTDTASTAFPGAIDAYHVTYVQGATTLTVTQPAVTRDGTTGAVTAQPALAVT
jgi:asparagine N-glycosylation enzyme membrane subunit Stt3